MAQPFSPQQRDAIREKLKESARKYAVSTGVKKTSLDMLTADAGISKSSFYKFYDSKELLFLEIAADWESQIIAAVNESLTKGAAVGSWTTNAAAANIGLCRVYDHSRSRHLQFPVRRFARIGALHSRRRRAHALSFLRTGHFRHASARQDPLLPVG